MNINAPGLSAETISIALETVDGHQVAHAFSPRVEVGTSRVVLVQAMLSCENLPSKAWRVLECPTAILWPG
jgi:hypothetical protein